MSWLFLLMKGFIMGSLKAYTSFLKINNYINKNTTCNILLIN